MWFLGLDVATISAQFSSHDRQVTAHGTADRRIVRIKIALVACSTHGRGICWTAICHPLTCIISGTSQSGASSGKPKPHKARKRIIWIKDLHDEFPLWNRQTRTSPAYLSFFIRNTPTCTIRTDDCDLERVKQILVSNEKGG